ncbi:MAG: hypothetical protein JSW49_04915 [candidate division WOR-3 bacterium]|nr:MAG: hypothetical protein JSW49_04915 [candidate division WOR-3 bacterium]
MLFKKTGGVLMFTGKILIQISIVILGVNIHALEASSSLQERDSVGRMSDITVTAPRYDNQDEAWAGMVEGIVVEAQHESDGVMESVRENESNGAIRTENPMQLFLPLTLALATISILYMSLHVYSMVKEVRHE